MLKNLLIILSLNLFFISNLYSQSDSGYAIIKGNVTNEKNKKLTGVKIDLKSTATKIEISGSSYVNGEYFFEVKAGIYNISAAYSEFVPYENDNIKVAKGETKIINIVLSNKIYTTEEIEVEESFKQKQNDLRTSLFNITPSSVKILPGSLEDVMRSLKSLPGISSPNDFTSQLIIRGSSPDQNLIVMDEVEIFNPYRLYGLVSMFNPETLSDINLITGGFPAKYGDRLSAVLDVINKEGTRDKTFSAAANIDIASANLILQGKNPLSIPGSWIISSRRTYYDLILGPFARNAGLITDNSSFPSFEDLQFKVAFGPFKKNKFFINGIFSRDGVDIIPGAERTNPDSVIVNDVTHNNVASLSWHYIPNPDFISKTTLSWYTNDGNNDFEGDILDPLIDKENLTPAQRDSLKAIGALLGFNFASTYNFKKYSLGNRSVYINNNAKYEFGGGVDIIKTDLTYSLQLDDAFKAFLRSLPNSQALLSDFTIQGDYNYRGNAYGQARFQLGEKFYYQPSMRVDYYSFLKAAYFSPRINFGYAINPLTTIRSAVGLYYQSPGYEKLIDNQTFYTLTSDIGEKLKAERAIHFVLGLDRWLNNEWLLKIETYYKKFDNVIVQQKLQGSKYLFTLNDPNNTDPNYIKNPNNWTRSANKVAYDSLTAVPVNGADGNSYGIEFSLEKKYMSSKTKLYGWMNVSISKSVRTRDGLEYPFRFDQPFIANVVLNYRVKDWFEVGAKWEFASNFPFTPPLGIVPRVAYDSLVKNPFTNTLFFNLDYGPDANRYTGRKPDYHKLDIRMTAYTRFWNADWSFYIDVMNVYNRKNVLTYQYTITSDLKIKRTETGMIPILPTIGISAKF